jgi:hypothetical protein
MKISLYLVVVAFVAAVYVSTVKIDSYTFYRVALQAETPQQKLRQYSDACLSVSGVSQESLRKVRNREHVDDPKLWEHAVCIVQKGEFIDSNGDFLVDNIKTKFKQDYDHPEKVDDLVAKCAVKKDTLQNTCFEFVKCIHRNRSKVGDLGE